MGLLSALWSLPCPCPPPRIYCPGCVSPTAEFPNPTPGPQVWKRYEQVCPPPRVCRQERPFSFAPGSHRAGGNLAPIMVTARFPLPLLSKSQTQ